MSKSLRRGTSPPTSDRGQLVAARDDVVVEFSLQTTSPPIAVSNWSALPVEVKAVLPSQEDFTRTLSAAFEETKGADTET